MAIYLGIDAGGTKTALSLVDEKGNILSQTEMGTIHPKQVESEQIIKTLRNGLEELLKSTEKSIEDIQFTFAGVPGYGEFPEIIKLYNDIFTELFPNKNYKLGNDCVAGWAGSGAGKPGVNMVLGTGAIAYGIDYKENEERSSGWGPYCGDEGSAYWLGRKAIALFGKESDGRAPKSALYEIIREEYTLVNDFDFISVVLELEDNRTEIAKFSKILSRAASQGDEKAREIIQEAAFEASIAIKAIIDKLDFEEKEEIYVTYSGGVFKIGEMLTNEIAKLLESDNRVKVLDSILSPMSGACLLALKYGNIEITDEIVENLK